MTEKPKNIFILILLGTLAWIAIDFCETKNELELYKSSVMSSIYKDISSIIYIDEGEIDLAKSDISKNLNSKISLSFRKNRNSDEFSYLAGLVFANDLCERLGVGDFECEKYFSFYKNDKGAQKAYRRQRDDTNLLIDRSVEHERNWREK